MHIAIIGGGITGLTAAYELTKHGTTVTVYEKDEILGGLANGFSGASWDWKLEKTYHHFFTNDKAIIALAKELGLKQDLMTLSPTTSVYWNSQQYPFDTPINILKFPGLSLVNRLRTGATAALMKLNPFWKPLEAITAKKFFQFVNGKNAWKIIWEPLLDAKFGPYADSVAASWLWARLYKRTAKLGYFKRGFSHFVDALSVAVKKNGGAIHTNTRIEAIKKNASGYRINNTHVDAILLTTPSSIASRLLPFPQTYMKQLHSIPHLFAQTLILETKKPILEKTYWLNVNDRQFPFLAVVAHTNMIDKKHYGGRHITYIGNYLPEGHTLLTKTKEEVLTLFMPFIKKISPSVKPKDFMNTYLFTAPNAQPVHTCGYSNRAPTLNTPLPHIYLANLDSIYPWDRGTNYAVDLGRRVAKKILTENKSL